MKNNNGKRLEKLIGHLEKNLRPLNAVVKVDEKLQTKYGKRQFDVTIRFKNAPGQIILIEAKDFDKKPPVEKVEAFIQKCRLVENSLGIKVFVTRSILFHKIQLQGHHF